MTLGRALSGWTPPVRHGASHAPTTPTATPTGVARTRCVRRRADVTLEQKEPGQMSTIATKDGTEIYYKDWGKGPAVTFSHGWPLNSDAWDGQMLFLVQNGFRAIALDRRGHGRSSQPSLGNDMDTYADDLAALIEALDLHDVTLVGHSTGGGEVARYIGRYETKRVGKRSSLPRCRR